MKLFSNICGLALVALLTRKADAKKACCNDGRDSAGNFFHHATGNDNTVNIYRPDGLVQEQNFRRCQGDVGKLPDLVEKGRLYWKEFRDCDNNILVNLNWELNEDDPENRRWIVTVLGEKVDELNILCNRECTDDDYGANGCFSASAQVLVQGKGSVAMEDLQVDDMVLSTGGHSKASYEPVYAFGHYETNEIASFLQLHTKNAKPLELTPMHLVFLEDHANPVRADSIKVGDVLLCGHDNRCSGAVTKIKTVVKQGVYAPLTPSGILEVDGFVASVYTSLQDETASAEYAQFQGGRSTGFSHHDGVHLIMSPFRLLCRGLTPNICQAQDNKQGMPLYISKGLDFVEWVDEQNIVIQGLAFVVFLTACAACMLLEVAMCSIFTLPLLPIIVAAWIHWNNKRNVQVWKKKEKQI